MTRREQLHPEIRRLREDEGLKWREIGERLGLALSTVRDYYFDPTGEAVRVRKAKFERPCDTCGKTISPNGVRAETTTCRTCVTLREQDRSAA